MDRRELLLAGTLATLGLLVGCRDEDAEAPPEAAPEPDPEPAPQPDPPVPDDPPVDEAPDPAPDDVEEEPEETPAAQRLPVVCRDALGLAAATAAGPAHRIDRITLHHTAVELGVNELAPERLRGHQRFHLDQGWPDIAYHYAVDLRGNVYELRDPDTAGDTFTAYDPAGHFLIVCEGNYDHEQPTDRMLHGVSFLLAHAADAYGVDVDTLTGHRDHVTGITCPGDNLQSRLGELRATAARVREQGPVELAEVCGERGRAAVAAIEQGAGEEATT